MTTFNNEAVTQDASGQEAVTQETRATGTLTSEAVIKELADTHVDGSIEVVSDRQQGDRRQPRHLFGWLLVAVAVAASIVLAMLVVANDESTRVPVPDAKDHPNFGPVVTPPIIGDAPVIGDAKDHPGYGSSSATCQSMPEPAAPYCPPPG